MSGNDAGHPRGITPRPVQAVPPVPPGGLTMAEKPLGESEARDFSSRLDALERKVDRLLALLSQRPNSETPLRPAGADHREGAETTRAPGANTVAWDGVYDKILKNNP